MGNQCYTLNSNIAKRSTKSLEYAIFYNHCNYLDFLLQTQAAKYTVTVSVIIKSHKKWVARVTTGKAMWIERFKHSRKYVYLHTNIPKYHQSCASVKVSKGENTVNCTNNILLNNKNKLSMSSSSSSLNSISIVKCLLVINDWRQQQKKK